MADSSTPDKRSKRTNRRAAARSSALDELKAARKGEKKKFEEEIDNVYDIVDESEYSELVSNRQNDDWIVDDDGGNTNFANFASHFAQF